jgi:hypothetical protein
LFSKSGSAAATRLECRRAGPLSVRPAGRVGDCPVRTGRSGITRYGGRLYASGPGRTTPPMGGRGGCRSIPLEIRTSPLCVDRRRGAIPRPGIAQIGAGWYALATSKSMHTNISASSFTRSADLVGRCGEGSRCPRRPGPAARHAEVRGRLFSDPRDHISPHRLGFAVAMASSPKRPTAVGAPPRVGPPLRPERDPLGRGRKSPAPPER